MRKKTIKYYFFNSIIKNPAINYLFCFSKRAFKQNKQQLKIKHQRVNIKKSKKKLIIIQHLDEYKRNININVVINQWNKNQNKIINFFFKSYFNNNRVRSLIRKKQTKINKQLNFWFNFKNYFYKKLKNKLKKFPKMGILSSHYVHMLSRKNLTYQTRSKYRSKVVTLNYFNNYIYTYTKFIYIYLYNMNSFIYFFSSNNMHKNIWLDSDFCVNKSSWHTNTLNIKKKIFTNITSRNKFYKLNNFNTENYINDDINKLYENKLLVELFLFEEDSKKKDEIYKELSQKIDIKSLNYIYTVTFFINFEYTNNYKKIIKNYLYNYIYFYKNLALK